MTAEPARPSPIAAPMAPPPRASPPPTMASPSVMFPPSPSAAWARTLISLLVSFVRKSWIGGRGRSVVGSLVLAAHRLTEVDQGEQGEDQRLDHPDEHVEELPDRIGQPQDVGGHQRDDGHHDPAGEDVAEEPQGERGRTRKVLRDELDRGEERVRLGEVAEVGLGALRADARNVDPDDHEQGQRVDEVDVRGGRRQPVLRRQRGEPVAREDEREHGDAEAHHAAWRADAHALLGLVLHPGRERLERDLEARRAAVGRAVGHVVAQTAHDESGDDRADDRVDVERQPTQLNGPVLTGCDGALCGEDHFCRISLINGSIELTIARNWNSARPPITAMPSGRTSQAITNATTVTSARRPSTEPEKRAFEGRVEAKLATDRSASHRLSVPRAIPTARNRP